MAATTKQAINNNATTRKGDDCFLCKFFPFLRSIFPPARDHNLVQDPVVQHNNTFPPVAAVPPIIASQQEEDHYSNNNGNRSNDAEPATVMDFAGADYRGFLFAIHPVHGYILLHCTRKKKKPNHFQLPGGHIDGFEFTAAAEALDNNKDDTTTTATNPKMEQLLLAGKMGAARELYEETGLDLRHSLDRLEPAMLYDKPNKKSKLSNEYKQRLFYTIHLTDDDFLKEENLPIADAAFLQRAMGAQPPNLFLKLSHEHQGFAFEKHPDVAATLLQHHSGGKVSEALKMACAVKNQGH